MYPFTDTYWGRKIKQGEIFVQTWHDYKTQPGTYFTTEAAVDAVGRSAQALANGSQVHSPATKPYNGQNFDPSTYAANQRVKVFEATRDFYAAEGLSLANKQHGDGGLPQLYVPEAELRSGAMREIDELPRLNP